MTQIALLPRMRLGNLRKIDILQEIKSFFARMKFCGSAQIIDEVTEVETIAVNHSVRVKNYLSRKYGRGRWRKLKGQTTVRMKDGAVCRVEIHWYSAHGIGNVDCKIKMFCD